MTVPRRALLLPLLCFSLLSASAAWGAEHEQLRLARWNFEYGKYDEALALVATLMNSKLLDEGPELVEAYRIQGLSNFYLGRRPQARSSFVQLLSVDPDFSLDPLLVPPAALQEFEAVKKENEALLAPIRDRRRAIAEQRRLEEAARRRLLEEQARRAAAQDDGPVLVQRVEKHAFLINLLPFGAAQFEQDRLTVGYAIAAAQAVTTGLSLFTYSRYTGLFDDTSDKVRAGRKSEAERWRLANWIAFGASLGAYAYGVVDAIRHYEEEKVTVIAVPRDSLPAALPAPEERPSSPSATLFLTPVEGGAAAGLSGRF